MSVAPAQRRSSALAAADDGAQPGVAGRGFPPSVRLRRSGDFERVFARGRRSADAYFTVVSRRAPSDSARLGLAISRRCAQRAVARNRIKRLVRESFRAERRRLPALDLVVMCRRAAAGADNATLRRSLAGHWQRLRSTA